MATIAPRGEGFELAVQLNDWQEFPVETGSASLTVEHDEESDGVSTIGAAIERGNGLFTVTLMPQGVGLDRFRITADDGIRPVILTPSPHLCVGDIEGGLSADCNGNAIADECEIVDELIDDINGNGIPDPCEQFDRGD